MTEDSDRKPRQILATVKTLPAPESVWHKLERVSKVIGAVAIPVTVAVLAWNVQLQTVEITTKQHAQVAEMSARLQTQIADATARQEYVKLAVSILRDPLDVTKQTPPQPLRAWAVSLLEKHSPVALTPQAKQGLESGQITLPTESAPCFPEVSGSCTADPLRARVGEVVTFSGNGEGGSGAYAYSWVGDDGLDSRTRQVQFAFSTPGTKSATVRITSNGQSVYRTCEVVITP